MPIYFKATRKNQEQFKRVIVNSGIPLKGNLRCLVFNCQSLCNKPFQVMEHVMDYEADIVFLSETWLKSQKNEVTSIVKDYGYTLKHSIRKNRTKETGGGVGILVKKCLTCKIIKVKQFDTVELCIVKIRSQKKWITCISIYRLDYEDKELFFKEFTELLELFTITEKCIIAGDINIHCDNIDDPTTIRFNSLLEAFDLNQFIDKPTQRKGHTLMSLLHVMMM